MQFHIESNVKLQNATFPTKLAVIVIPDIIGFHWIAGHKHTNTHVWTLRTSFKLPTYQSFKLGFSVKRASTDTDSSHPASLQLSWSFGNWLLLDAIFAIKAIWNGVENRICAKRILNYFTSHRWGYFILLVRKRLASYGLFSWRTQHKPDQAIYSAVLGQHRVDFGQFNAWCSQSGTLACKAKGGKDTQLCNHGTKGRSRFLVIILLFFGGVCITGCL